MFGFFEAIYAFLTRQLGMRNDSASETGSLHAKVRRSNNTIDSINASVGQSSNAANRNGSVHAKLRNIDPDNKDQMFISNYYSSLVSGSDIFTINGSGVVKGLYIESSTSAVITLTVDGNVFFSSDELSRGDFMIPVNIPFSSSFRIGVSNNSGVFYAFASYLAD